MASKPLPSPEVLRQLLRYEPETGKLFWRARGVEMFATKRHCNMWNARYADAEAFISSGPRGHLRGKIYGKTYYVHRIIWAMRHGVWPTHEIDHVDGDPVNNRLENLRDVPKSLNQRNTKMRRNNTSGATGVIWYEARGKWQATIRLGGKQRHLGLFTDIEDAIAARKAAEAGHGFTSRHGMVINNIQRGSSFVPRDFNPSTGEVA